MCIILKENRFHSNLRRMTMNSTQIKTLGLMLALSFVCLSSPNSENYFIQARAYDMFGFDSLALVSYEKAYECDPSSKFLKDEVTIRNIRRGNYDKALDLMGTSMDIIQSFCDPKKEANYKDGDALAKFYLYFDNAGQASELWKGLILNAVAFHHLDSALILSDSFVKNMPQDSEAHMMQSKLSAAYKHKMSPSPVQSNQERN
jgi:hypothetical protein